jgi:hypothetical protein
MTGWIKYSRGERWLKTMVLWQGEGVGEERSSKEKDNRTVIGGAQI